MTDERDVSGESRTECYTCGEGVSPDECAESKRACGHHCNHSWTHDGCCWCGVDIAAEGEGAVSPAEAPLPALEFSSDEVFFACSELERMTATSAEEAIEEFYESRFAGLEPLGDETLDEARVCMAWVRSYPDAENIAERARHAAETLFEGFDEDYGDPDGPAYTQPDEEVLHAAEVFARVAAVRFPSYYACERAPDRDEEFTLREWLHLHPGVGGDLPEDE